MKPDLKDVVSLLSERFGQFKTKKGAHGNCALASVFTHDFLKKIGFKPQIHTTYYKDAGHYFLVVDKMVLDFTFRQFEPKSAFPLFVKYTEAPEPFKRNSYLDSKDLKELADHVRRSLEYPMLLMRLER